MDGWTTYKVKEYCGEKCMIEKIIKQGLKLGADDIVCNITDAIEKQVKFVNDEIVVNKFWNSKTIEVFLAYKGRVISSIVPPTVNISNFLKRLIKTAKLLKPKEDYFGVAEGPFKYRPVK